jgi:serine/threonine protein kinase
MADEKPPLDVDTTLPAAEGAAAATPSWKAGQRIAQRYLLRRSLGRGGMGVVWAAFDEVLGKEVALKLFRADVLSADEARETMRREVLLAQKVTHANVCRIYDLECVDGSEILKMELLTGHTLATALPAGSQLPVAEACKIARQLAEGLTAIHAAGIVHRDLKPQNVMLDDESGRAIIMDFGIARFEASSGDSEPAKVVGTPEYMAPEQARAGAIDGRADLYALGCILYRMLAGRVPFPASTRLAAIARHLTDPPPDVRRVRAAVPAWLARLTLALMAKEPSRRPRDAATVVPLLQGPPRRWPRRLAAGAFAVVLLGALAVGTLLVREQRRQSWKPSIRPTALFAQGYSEHMALAPDGARIAFDVERDDKWRVYVSRLDGSDAVSVTPDGFHDPRWSSDGRTLYVSSGEHESFRVDAGGGAPTAMSIHSSGSPIECEHRGLYWAEFTTECPRCRRLMHRDPSGHVEQLLPADAKQPLRTPVGCAPGGDLLYTAGGGKPNSTQLFRWHDGAPALLLGGLRGVTGATFSDVSHVVYVAGTVDQHDLFEATEDGREPRQLTFDGHAEQPLITPDGQTLLFERNEVAEPLYALRYGEPRARRLTFGSARLFWMVTTRDGTGVVVAWSEPRGKATLIPLDGGPPRALADDVATPEQADGRLPTASLCYASTAHRDGDPWLIRSVAIAGGAPRDVATIDENNFSIEADGDGDRDGHVWLHWRRGLQPMRRLIAGGADEKDGPPLSAARLLQRPPAIAAPVGGWRAQWIPFHQIHLYAPGSDLGGPPSLKLAADSMTWSADGSAVLYFVRTTHELRRHALASGEDRLVMPLSSFIVALAESPDGHTALFTDRIAQSQGEVMTNFARRPR